MKEIKTKELVEELAKREGVQEITVKPYDKVEIKVKDQNQILDIADSGPCTILVIYD